MLSCHICLFREQRHYYYFKRDEALADPEETGSMIIDGYDQHKTNVPHFKGYSNPKVTIHRYLYLLITEGEKFSEIAVDCKRFD